MGVRSASIRTAIKVYTVVLLTAHTITEDNLGMNIHQTSAGCDHNVESHDQTKEAFSRQSHAGVLERTCREMLMHFSLPPSNTLQGDHFAAAKLFNRYLEAIVVGRALL